MPIESQWRDGTDEFTAEKISYFESHLREGGELRVGMNVESYQVASVLRQGTVDHGRAHKDGCIRSIIPTVEGDPELIGLPNRDGGYIYRE